MHRDFDDEKEPRYQLGKDGLIPLNKAARIEHQKVQWAANIVRWKKANREKRERLALHRLTKAYWWGFNKNRRTKQIAVSKRLPNRSSYSRGFFLDVYGAKIEGHHPGDLQFATHYFNPCKGVKPYVGAARAA